MLRSIHFINQFPLEENVDWAPHSKYTHIFVPRCKDSVAKFLEIELLGQEACLIILIASPCGI